MINHACRGMMHSHAKTVFKEENAFKEDPATVQVNYISLEQYKHKGKCMQKGEENRPGGRRRSSNAVEGLLARRSVWSSVPALSPLFFVRLLSFNICNLRQSLSNEFLHFLRPCCRSYMPKKMKPRPTGSPCWFMVSLLFSLFFSSFSSTVNLPNLTVTLSSSRRKKRKVLKGKLITCF